MKTLVMIGLASTGIFLATSCVSSRKYAALQVENKKFQDQVAALQTKNQKLQQTGDDFQRQLTDAKNQLQQKQTELADSKAEMAKNQSTLNGLKKAVKLEQGEISSIRQRVCNALKCFAPDEISVKEHNGELYVSMYDKLLFPTGSAIVNSRGKEALKMLSDVLNKDNDMEIMVEGHTDNVPIDNKIYKDNWDLSVGRATNVTRILIKDKIKPSRLIASGKSKFHPFYSNDNAKGRELNRRTDIVLVPKLENLYSLINQDNKLQLESMNKTSANFNIVNKTR
jgi:chemotaxis protein MotB